MKIDRMGESFTKLEKRQMLVIDKLQNKIKLLEFDKSSNLSEIYALKSKIKRTRESTDNIIKQLEKINKEEDYKHLWYIINCLKCVNRGDYYEKKGLDQNDNY